MEQRERQADDDQLNICPTAPGKSSFLPLFI
jgi:hypothetical protein